MRNRGMDTASFAWLKPRMRSGFVAVCGLLAIRSALWAQGVVAPSIVTPPANVQVFVGDTATFSVLADGTPPITYQWRKNGTNVGGATSTTLFLNAVAAADSALYDVVATNSAGAATSPPAFLYVNKRPQTITFNAPASAIAAGSGVTLNAAASSALPITYTLVAGAARLAGNVLTGNGGPVVVRASQAGNGTFDPAEPVEQTITFVAGALSPFIVSPPTDQTITAGATATFRAGAIGTPAPTYQWQKDGVPIGGATAATLTLTNTTLADSGRYTVTATNSSGNHAATATLTVQAAPVLTTTPASMAVATGDTVTLTVAASGFPPPTFQWRKNGTAMAGATSPTLAFRSVATTDAARYDVVVTNALGAVTSPAATLTVTRRDFGGAYFGNLSGGADPTGSFALLVRGNQTAALLGYDSALPAGIVLFDLAIEASGTFHRSVVSGTRTVTVQGTLNDLSGEITGEIPEVNRTFAGARHPPTSASAQAGLYQLAGIGTAADRAYAILADDGTGFALRVSGATADGGNGVIGTNGRLTVTTSSRTVIDLAPASGAMSGTVRTSAGATTTVAGALESSVGVERLVNLSMRSTTANAAPLIVGFVVTGASPKQVLLRAAGPTLGQAPFNVAGVVNDPTLQVFRGNTVIAQNDEWGTPAANGNAVTAASARAGAFPFRNGSADSALVTSVPAGAYTVQVGGGNGIVLAEIYEVLENNETPGARRLVNVSARGLVAPAAPMIAGFVIGGTAPQRVLLRAIGPTLGQPPFNVAGALPNPQLTLLRGNAVVKTNDDWFRDADASSIRDAAARAGAFALPGQSADAAMLLYLAPGAYTAQISGPPNANQANATGIVLVEVYAAP